MTNSLFYPLIFSLAKSVDYAVALDTRIRTVPRMFGPVWNRCGKFPFPVSLNLNQDIVSQMKEHVSRLNKIVKLQWKKTPNVNIAIGSLLLKPRELV